MLFSILLMEGVFTFWQPRIMNVAPPSRLWHPFWMLATAELENRCDVPMQIEFQAVNWLLEFAVGSKSSPNQL
jgi:hypothetical protein